jgi:hypothetical protein
MISDLPVSYAARSREASGDGDIFASLLESIVHT